MAEIYSTNKNKKSDLVVYIIAKNFWNVTQLVYFCCFFSTVSAEILKSSLTTMERHIQRLENDIENFPKTDDQQDKFVEKMSISFW